MFIHVCVISSLYGYPFSVGALVYAALAVAALTGLVGGNFLAYTTFRAEFASVRNFRTAFSAFHIDFSSNLM